MPYRTRAPRQHGSPGFTLMEALVALGILTTTLGLVGSAVFQVLSSERSWREGAVAIRELRHAGSWFSGDALNAVATDLVDGAPSVDSITISRVDASGAAHSATYRLSAGELIRESDGSQITLSRQVVSAAFHLSGRTLTFELAVAAGQSRMETARLDTYLRMLQP